jgi:hypothetical protein
VSVAHKDDDDVDHPDAKQHDNHAQEAGSEGGASGSLHPQGSCIGGSRVPGTHVAVVPIVPGGRSKQKSVAVHLAHPAFAPSWIRRVVAAAAAAADGPLVLPGLGHQVVEDALPVAAAAAAAAAATCYMKFPAAEPGGAHRQHRASL